MANILNVFRNITSPKKDFILFFEVQKDQYFDLVYEKIFMELASWLKSQKLNISACKFNKSRAILKASSKHAYELALIFERETVSLEVNGIDLGEARIYGFYLNKENLTVSKIKVDLSTFKRKLSEILK